MKARPLEDLLHWMDRVQIWALKKNHCFHGGWGDLAAVEHIAGELTDPPPLVPLEPDFSLPTRVLGADLRVGSFVSPAPGLPEIAREGRFWWLHPADQEVKGAVVAFASWGDEGPTMRGRILGPLVREGVSIVILENPYYGVRRPEGGLHTVADFIRMQGSAFIEGRALIRWMQRSIDAPVAVFGFSMGGHVGSAIATSLRTVPFVIAAPPLCPSEPMSAGPLQVGVRWDALGGLTPSVQERWVELMDAYDLRNLPGPAAPENTRVFGCLADGLVPPTHAAEVAGAWRTPFEWLDTGHVGVALTKGKVLRRALRDVLGIPQRDRRPVLGGATARIAARP